MRSRWSSRQLLYFRHETFGQWPAGKRLRKRSCFHDQRDLKNGELKMFFEYALGNELDCLGVEIYDSFLWIWAKLDACGSVR
jgi:hypothetical protein